ncbi:hypothetical protein TNCV_3650491 [Trichonephila clavipes]|uniref:Uncharacterized protein n=1 Tax=Trichonephila clavipes TaxID=2585209 RepID=A0A8X6SE24_TRICX|nr:hypothetical protein TNCV_3650491 [Trichonephila clavipes]
MPYSGNPEINNCKRSSHREGAYFTVVMRDMTCRNRELDVDRKAVVGIGEAIEFAGQCNNVRMKDRFCVHLEHRKPKGPSMRRKLAITQPREVVEKHKDKQQKGVPCADGQYCVEMKAHEQRNYKKHYVGSSQRVAILPIAHSLLDGDICSYLSRVWARDIGIVHDGRGSHNRMEFMPSHWNVLCYTLPVCSVAMR